jgi:hypothetical protein
MAADAIEMEPVAATVEGTPEEEEVLGGAVTSDARVAYIEKLRKEAASA